jgi:hypothetical protein
MITYRKCLNLRYTCQIEQPMDRATRKRGKIEKRLGFGLHNNSLKFKSKGMNWKTYDYLLSCAEAADRQTLDALGRKISVEGLTW